MSSSYKPPTKDEINKRLAAAKQATEGTLMLSYGSENTATTPMVAVLKIGNGDPAYCGSNQSSNKRSRPNSPTSPSDSAIKRVKRLTSEARKLLEVTRDLSTLENANAQAQARRLMLKDHIFLEKGKVTLLKVFRRHPNIAAEYGDIRTGLSDGTRRIWVREMMEDLSMSKEVAGLFADK